MADKDNKEEQNQQQPITGQQSADESQLDAASQSLSDALRVSFVVLKIIMVILVVAFLASGLKKVDTEEQALVLRFGKIRGTGEQRILDNGLHWIFPYPIDEIVKFPVARPENLAIDSFWYYQTLEERTSPDPPRAISASIPLYPLRDGYCLTRGETRQQGLLDSDGSDYNIVHTQWYLTYQIANPERFFRNIYVREVQPGEIYSDVIKESIAPLLQSMFEDAVVTAMVNYTIDEAISSNSSIPGHVLTLLQDKLDKIESGIRVIPPIQLTGNEVPRQVKDAFDKSTIAEQESDQMVEKAYEYAEATLNEAAGFDVAESLFAALQDENISEQEIESLWSQVSGEATIRITEAEVYAKTVEENARANVIYLQSLLPEYQQRPGLVIQQLYLDSLKDIFSNAEEKFIIQTGRDADNTEIRVLMNRDTSLVTQSDGEQNKEQE